MMKRSSTAAGVTSFGSPVFGPCSEPFTPQRDLRSFETLSGELDGLDDAKRCLASALILPQARVAAPSPKDNNFHSPPRELLTTSIAKLDVRRRLSCLPPLDATPYKSNDTCGLQETKKLRNSFTKLSELTAE